jgi:four helix bundle protein
MPRSQPGGYTVRDLIAWQKAMKVAEMVYRVTRGFPTDERFGLISQCRRASVSIAANIAEGHGRHGGASFVQFLRIAQGSALELETEMELAARLGYIDAETWSQIRAELDHTSRLLMNLTRAVARRAAEVGRVQRPTSNVPPPATPS